MNRFVLASAWLFLGFIGWPVVVGPTVARAEDAPEAESLVIELVDGSRLVGTVSSATLPIKTPYASFDFQLAEVESMEFAEDRETVTMRNGDRVTGVLGGGSFSVETILGPLKIEVRHIREISVRDGRAANLAQGLVLHYSFDESFEKTGQILDETGRGPALRVSKAPVRPTTGIRGGAAEFHGGVLSCDSNPTAGLKEMSLSIWFKTADPKRNYKLASAAWWRGGRNASGWNLGTHYTEMWADNRRPMFVDKLTTTAPQRAFAANEWNHLVVTFDREDFREYINGDLYRESKGTGVAVGNGANLTLGNWMGSFPYHGLLDEFMVFDRALRADEVRQLHDTIR